MDKLRVGVIGIGGAGRRHAKALRETGEAEIVAISRRSAGPLALAQSELGVPSAYKDWRELLEAERLDAVVVSTSGGSHPEPTIAALERGLDVFVEKPMALTGREASMMVEAAEKANRVLMVFYNCRFCGQWRWAKRAIDQGLLGKVRQVTANWCIDARWFLHQSEEEREAARAEAGPGSWRFDPTEAGPGLLIDVGTHFVDLALWLCGDEAARVYASGSSTDGGRTRDVSILARLHSDATCSLSFYDGVVGDGSRYYGVGNLCLWGEEGLVSADWGGTWNPHNAAVRIIRRGEPLEADAALEDIPPLACFVDVVRGKSTNPSPPEEAARAVYLMEAAMTAMDENRIVGLEGGSTRPA